MTRQKPSMTENLLRMSGVFKDYDKAVKLHERYVKDKEHLRTKPAQLEELRSCVKNAHETLLRFITAYSRANEEVKRDIKDDSQFYIPEQRESYLDTLKIRDMKMQDILKDIGEQRGTSTG